MMRKPFIAGAFVQGWLSTLAVGVAMWLLLSQLDLRLPTHSRIELQNSQLSVEVTEGPRLVTSRGSAAAGMVGGKLVVAGGTSWNADGTVKSFLSDSEVLDNGVWKKGPDLPSGLAESAFAQGGAGLYLAGGLVSANRACALACYITSVGGNMQVIKLSDLPEPICSCNGTIANGKFFVFCGQLGGQAATNRVWSLDLVFPHAKWVEMTPLPGPGRAFPGVVESTGNVYVLGGLADGAGTVRDRTLRDAYRYDPNADNWYSMDPLPMAGYYWGAAPVDPSHLLLAGRSDGEAHDEIWLLDLSTMTVVQVGKTVLATTCAPLVTTSPNTWWLIGGEPDSHKHRTNRVSEISMR